LSWGILTLGKLTGVGAAVGSVLRFFGFGSGSRRIASLTSRQWLWLGVLTSIVVQTLLSVLYYIELKDSEVGIPNMAEYSAAHGQFFLESTNYVRQGLPSLLEIHFSWVYLAALPLYAVLPSAMTLFAIQAVALASAAIPLYYLVVDLTRSELKGVICSGIYLSWFPIYLANPENYHLEAFLPLLLFGTFLLFYRKRYWSGLAVGALAAFTLDGMGIFTALIGVFFLSYPLQAAYRVWRKRRQRESGSRVGVAGEGSPFSYLGRLLASLLRMRTVQFSLALVLVSALVFVSMRELEVSVANALGSPGGSLSVTRISGFLAIGPKYVTTDFTWKLEFWLVVLASVGFLPFLSPRTWVILLPWVLYSFLISTATFTLLTYPHVDVVAFPVFLGVAYAMRNLPVDSPYRSDRASSPKTEASRDPTGQAETEGGSGQGARRVPTRLLGPRIRVAVIAFLISIVLANMILNPIDPLVQQPLERQHGPFSGNAYTLTWPPPPGFASVAAIAGLIPADAYAVASPPLYPLVSFDREAFPLALGEKNYPFLPSSGLPAYVFTQWNSAGEVQLNELPLPAPYADDQLGSLVWNQSFYGIRAWTQSSPLGSTFLFELGFSGSAATYGGVSYPTILTYSVGHGLTKSPNASIYRTSYNGSTIETVRSAGLKTGIVWSTTPRIVPIPPGSYEMSMSLNVAPSSGNCSAVGLAGNTVVLEVSLGEFVTTPAREFSLNYGNVICGGWSVAFFSFYLSSPLAEITIQALRPPTPNNLVFEFASIQVSPFG
jgi:uncharacterized membrane protein